jgi:hypothetical protein
MQKFAVILPKFSSCLPGMNNNDQGQQIVICFGRARQDAHHFVAHCGDFAIAGQAGGTGRYVGS